MKLFDNIKDFFLPPEVPYEQENEQEAPVRGRERPEYLSGDRTTNDNEYYNQPSYDTSDSFETEESAQEKRNKMFNIQTTAQLQVVLVKPEVFTDAKQIADHLIAKKTVVLNLETASSENKRRIIDFLVGVAYANGGSLKPVANLTYIITPYNVGFVGADLVGELENNGVII